jgi:cell division cycle 14
MITAYSRKMQKELLDIDHEARISMSAPIHLVHHCSSKPKILAN